MNKSIQRVMIMTKMARTLIYLVIVVLTGFSAIAQNESGKQFLWEVNQDSATVYLVGSIHMLDESIYPLPSPYTDAFNSSDQLILEMNLDSLDLGMVTGLLLKRGVYTDSRTLKGMLPDSTWQLAKAKIESFGFDISMMNKFRPWFVMLTISALEMQNRGFKAEHGLDMYFYNLAKEKAMPISGLESLADQVMMFDDVPDSVQVRVLQHSLVDSESQSDQLDDIVSAWRNGDTKGIEDIVMGDLKASPEAYDAVLVKRNHNWYPKIRRLLNKRKTTFVVIGAGHLIGDEGLLELLRKDGYQVIQR
jgi:uncharacterized protein